MDDCTNQPDRTAVLCGEVPRPDAWLDWRTKYNPVHKRRRPDLEPRHRCHGRCDRTGLCRSAEWFCSGGWLLHLSDSRWRAHLVASAIAGCGEQHPFLRFATWCRFRIGLRMRNSRMRRTSHQRWWKHLDSAERQHTWRVLYQPHRGLERGWGIGMERSPEQSRL